MFTQKKLCVIIYVYIYVYNHICIYFAWLCKEEDTEKVNDQGWIGLENRNEKWDTFLLQKFHFFYALN